MYDRIEKYLIIYVKSYYLDASRKHWNTKLDLGDIYH